MLFFIHLSPFKKIKIIIPSRFHTLRLWYKEYLANPIVIILDGTSTRRKMKNDELLEVLVLKQVHTSSSSRNDEII